MHIPICIFIKSTSLFWPTEKTSKPSSLLEVRKGEGLKHSTPPDTNTQHNWSLLSCVTRRQVSNESFWLNVFHWLCIIVKRGSCNSRDAFESILSQTNRPPTFIYAERYNAVNNTRLTSKPIELVRQSSVLQNSQQPVTFVAVSFVVTRVFLSCRWR